jgi:hypothetical protein
LERLANRRLEEADALAELKAEAWAKAEALRSKAADFLSRMAGLPNLHFLGVIQPGETPFLAIPSGINLIGPGAFDGIQGGLLGDLGARDGQGVIGNSVVITLTLSDPLNADEAKIFQDELRRSSLVEYGNRAAFASPAVISAVPEPSTVTLMVASGVTLLGTKAFRRIKNRRSEEFRNVRYATVDGRANLDA